MPSRVTALTGDHRRARRGQTLLAGRASAALRSPRAELVGLGGGHHVGQAVVLEEGAQGLVALHGLVAGVHQEDAQGQGLAVRQVGRRRAAPRRAAALSGTFA